MTIPEVLDLLSGIDVESTPEDMLGPLLATLTAKAAEVAQRLSSSSDGREPIHSDHDKLLDVEEAARRLGVGRTWLYKRTSKLPFVVRLGHKKLRFSANGIESYIRRHRGY